MFIFQYCAALLSTFSSACAIEIILYIAKDAANINLTWCMYIPVVLRKCSLPASICSTWEHACMLSVKLWAWFLTSTDLRVNPPNSVVWHRYKMHVNEIFEFWRANFSCKSIQMLCDKYSLSTAYLNKALKHSHFLLEKYFISLPLFIQRGRPGINFISFLLPPHRQRHTGTRWNIVQIRCKFNLHALSSKTLWDLARNNTVQYGELDGATGGTDLVVVQN